MRRNVAPQDERPRRLENGRQHRWAFPAVQPQPTAAAPINGRPRFRPTADCPTNQMGALQSHVTDGSRLSADCLIDPRPHVVLVRLGRSSEQRRHRRIQAISCRPPTPCLRHLKFRVRSPTQQFAAIGEQVLAFPVACRSLDREATSRTRQLSAAHVSSDSIR